MQRLDPLTLPLHGRRLIEASAGTGKTYTIAALYLRLLLERRLAVDEILVVTFTEAATEELRGRIRARIRELLRLLQGEGDGDPLLNALAANLDPAQALPLLDSALKRMDEAAIFTIHGFCRRMLSENAFESGLSFDTELTTDLSELLEQVSQDDWRERFYPLDTPLVDFVRGHWPTPETLEHTLRPWLSHAQAQLLPQGVGDFADSATELGQKLRALSEQWVAQRADIETLVLGNPALNASSYSKRNVPNWLGKMDHFFAQATLGTAPPDCAARFTPVGLAEKTKAGQATPEHPLFNALADYLQRHAELHLHLLADALQSYRMRLAALKLERNLLGFDDLLSHLDHALQGPSGAALGAAIRSRFPVALIDEFQDTDPQQYRIFEQLYREQQPASATPLGLFLIGDPKQAIYSFRGADIFTYLDARNATDPDSGRFTLGTNWRSVSPLVAGVNTLFARHPAPFLLREGIDFQPVAAGGQSDAAPFTLDGQRLPPLQWWHLGMAAAGCQADKQGRPKPIGKGRGRELILLALADECAALLTAGGEGRARIGERPLAPEDIAVLVATHFQASQVQQALAGRGISSVVYSRDSVFQSDEAQALVQLLEAVASPTHEGSLRAALATHLLGNDAAQLEALFDSELAWEEQLLRFGDYHQRWLSQGLMSMLQRLLRDYQVAPRLLAQSGGERRLTDLLQLAELLQEASQRCHGMEGLLRWFEEQRSNPNGNDEGQQLRLESDAPLVKIITIHKSKGLEYPVVFLPFLWDRSQEHKEGPKLFHDPEGRASLDLGSDDAATLEAWRREGLAEALRLLYVAITRARTRCYLVWGKFSGAERSGLAWLLHAHADDALADLAATLKELDDAATLAPLTALVSANPEAHAVSALPTPSHPDYQPRLAQSGALSARHFSGAIHGQWRIGSYSTLASGIHGHLPAELPDYDAGVEESPELTGEQLDRFSFPRGARAGTFLHSLFELVDFTTAGGEALHELTLRQLQRFGIEAKWAGVVVEWIGQVLDTPLDGQGLALRGVSNAQRLVEMEFYFPAKRLEASVLDQICADYFGRDDLPPLKSQQLSGLMKGFIDLVFESDGRYYVVDYKSNHLGDSSSAYREERSREAMFAHRYELQYLIYSLALHRYLCRRLPGYDPQQHLGGVYYLFLRGMPEAGVYADRPPIEVIEQIEQAFGLESLL